MAKPRPSRSKTGRPECSEAVRAWKTTGMNHAIALVLAQCRALAKAQGQAALHEAAGVHVAKARALVKHHHEQVTKAHAARTSPPKSPKPASKSVGKPAGDAVDKARKTAEKTARAEARKAKQHEEYMARERARAEAERARLDAAKGRSEQALRDAGRRSHLDAAPRLREAAGAARDDRERKLSVLAVIREHTSTETHARQVHGMGQPQDFHSLHYEGQRWHFVPLPADHDAALAHPVVATLADLAQLPPLPAALMHPTRHVYFTGQRNARDPEYAERYAMPGFTSAATGGDGKVAVYGGHPLDITTYAHEMGHNLAYHHYGSIHPPEGSDYRRAMDTGERAVSDYGSKSASEDFAETAKWYVMHPDHLKANHPERYEVFHRLIQEPGHGG